MTKDSEEKRPPWLLRMENGSAGEARTKSFLIDRFWILERSVDIDGADFIIQRRLNGVNLLDKEPPRLGVVQVKFYESEATTQYLHKEYVTDSDGNPRGEFFLICQTGKGDASSSYLLSAKDIAEEFKLTDATHSKPNCFVIPGKTLLQSRKYEIVSRDMSLDRIERSLAHADFVKNRRFLSWAIPGAGDVNNSVMPLYQEPLENWYGNIPEQFIELKKKVRRAVFDIEEVLEKLNEMLMTDDPEKALEIAEDIYHEYGQHVSLPGDLYNEDFYSVVREHKERHANLRNDGILDRYLKLQTDCIQFICTDLAKFMPIDSAKAYLLKVVYDGSLLTTWSFSSELMDVEGLFVKNEDEHWSYKDAPSTKGIYSSASGNLTAYILAGRYGYRGHVKGKPIEESGKSWEERLENVARMATREIMDEIYQLRFGE